MTDGVSQPFMRTVSRRPGVEQKILTILRGEAAPPEDARRLARRMPPPPPKLPAKDKALFERLREQARSHGLSIRVAGAPFIHDDELRLLAWLAHGQRLSRDLDAIVADRDFLDLILDCALVLERLGLHLPARSLVNFQELGR